VSARGVAAATALALLAALAVGGCGADEHGLAAYAGPTDPLVEKLGDPEFTARLQERFRLGQTDR
jgi:hypothetical protein